MSEVASSNLITDVLVVGAGPTGLMLANWLARSGIDAVIIDPKSGPTRESRALGMQARTMEIYDQLGVIDEVLARCRKAEFVQPGFERRRFSRISFGTIGTGLTPYPGIYVLEQSENERILSDNLSALGREVLWGYTLRDLNLSSHSGARLDDRSRPVEAALEKPDGSVVTVRARYCVGADGSRSAVRRGRKIAFQGRTNEHIFYVADARDVSGVTGDGINVRFGEKDFLLSFPMSGTCHHRLLGVVRAERDVDAGDIVEQAVRERIEPTFGVTYGRSDWFATYRVHHLVAAVFRDGPFFLAGDAAHVHSPVGAQGMNTGLQDAHNLALKLIDVIAGRASDVWLDRYEAERRPVALRLVSTTDRAFGVVTSDRLASRLFRRLAIPVIAPLMSRFLPRLPAANRAFQYVSQIRIHYWMSDAERDEARGKRGAIVGRRLPWVPRRGGDNYAVLRSAEWQIHEYGSVDAAVVRRLRDELRLPIHIFPASAHTRLVPGVFYLVRPDGFVAASARATEAAEVFARAMPGAS